ncbi:MULTISPECIES: GNAT family N-acetyltransferase [unclassified Inquilinus]|uniref:GNAT family N-acetyltransferase n=1 Tax=unclassified Inquilinus TaxID=2645927 RepID=UPI003F904EB3
MTDLLVKLYALEAPTASRAAMAAAGVTIRPAIGPEKRAVANWVAERFGDGWASEVEVAFARLPVSCLVAVRDGALLGFGCYDATARGFFGPTAVDPDHRGKGIGEALLRETLEAMRHQGHAYAIIGAAGPIAFYEKIVGATQIPGSTGGLYHGMIRSKTD